MENLVSDIQQIFNKIRKDDENKRFLHFSPQYSPIVKVSDWFSTLEADPKDNDPYNPPGGNYFLSTYRRFGNDVTDMETTTQAMLSQICSPELNQKRTNHKAMISAATQQLSEELPFKCDRLICDKEDYTTTYSYDYRHPFPYKKIYYKKPELEEKRRFGLSSNFSPKKICETKFLDDELYEMLNRKVPIPKVTPPYNTDERNVC